MATSNKRGRKDKIHLFKGAGGWFAQLGVWVAHGRSPVEASRKLDDSRNAMLDWQRLKQIAEQSSEV